MFLTREWSEPESQVVLLKNQDLRLRGSPFKKDRGARRTSAGDSRYLQRQNKIDRRKCIVLELASLRDSSLFIWEPPPYQAPDLNNSGGSRP